LSLQTFASFAVNTHLVDGLQVSSVQGLLSLQTRGDPPAQAPFWQRSPTVHALKSLHELVLFTWTHSPVARSHESVVHTFSSLQGSGEPRQTPLLHTSLRVHGFPSSQGLWLKAKPQPRRGWQVAVVHGFASSGQATGVPTQVPFSQ
jgi:hypothetical protein